MNSNQAKILIELISKFNVSKLSINSIKSLVKINKKLKSELEDYYEAQNQLFESYGIEAKSGSFNWKDHEKADEITKKVNELVNAKLDLGELDLLEEDEFYACVSSEMNINEITFCEEFLIKK